MAYFGLILKDLDAAGCFDPSAATTAADAAGVVHYCNGEGLTWSGALYSLVRKGSMGTPAEVLQAF